MKQFSIMSEQEVLDLLEIPNFRCLSKEKFMTFATYISFMKPQIAIRVIEQIPCYVELAKSTLCDFKEVVATCVRSNDEGIRQYYSVVQTKISLLQGMLESEHLSFEEKKYVFEILLDIQEMLGQKDSENKKFNIKVILVSGTFFLVGLGLTASLLGINTTMCFGKKVA